MLANLVEILGGISSQWVDEKSYKARSPISNPSTPNLPSKFEDFFHLKYIATKVQRVWVQGT